MQTDVREALADMLYADVARPSCQAGLKERCRCLKCSRERARAAIAASPQAEQIAEPLKGWKLNHVQFVRGSGTAQIGYLDPEDDRFSPVVTVDTGLYYRKDDALLLASAILEAIASPKPAQAEPALARFHKFGADEECDPVERLRAFCSFAMSGQDWLDVEPFFDTLAAAPKRTEG